MNPKEELVSTIVHDESWGGYIECMKKCMNILSIISDVKANLRFNNFMDSYSKIVKEFGTEVLFTPEKTRDELVELLNKELKNNHDLFATFKLCNAVILLGKNVKVETDSTTVQCVLDLLSCIDSEKLTSYELYMSFYKLKNIL